MLVEIDRKWSVLIKSDNKYLKYGKTKQIQKCIHESYPFGTEK